MPITFAAAASHAPGITAWAEVAPPVQKDNFLAAYDRLRHELERSETEVLIMLTSEHWVNFFLDHISAFCIGRAEHFIGPVEPWLRVEEARLSGDPALARDITERCYDYGIEPSFSLEMALDHGTMVPLHLLTPRMNYPVIPIMFNTLVDPQPSARRCLEFGKALGRFAADSPKRIGFVATGGLSHDPCGRHHGTIDSQFDRRFLDQMAACDVEQLGQYTRSQFAAAGSGAFELLAWIALAGAVSGRQGRVLGYEAIKPWATGVGVVHYEMTRAAADAPRPEGPVR
jgi:aromatic ring-opening dioxygenase catalytic subunit (LigB family)